MFGAMSLSVGRSPVIKEIIWQISLYQQPWKFDAVREYSFYDKALNPETGSSRNVFVLVNALDVNDNAPCFTA